MIFKNQYQNHHFIYSAFLYSFFSLLLLYLKQSNCWVLCILWLVPEILILKIYLEFMVWFHFGNAVINSWSLDVLSDLRCHLVACIWYIQLYFTLPSVWHPLLLRKENIFEITCKDIYFHFKHRTFCTLLSVFSNMHVCFGLC